MMRGTRRSGDDAPEGLSIGELERRTGVPGATLRTWESRYAAFVPDRRPGGHRRYTEVDVELAAEIVRRRAACQQLAAAVETAKRAANPPSTRSSPRYDVATGGCAPTSWPNPESSR